MSSENGAPAAGTENEVYETEEGEYQEGYYEEGGKSFHFSVKSYEIHCISISS